MVTDLHFIFAATFTIYSPCSRPSQSPLQYLALTVAVFAHVVWEFRVNPIASTVRACRYLRGTPIAQFRVTASLEHLATVLAPNRFLWLPFARLLTLLSDHKSHRLHHSIRNRLAPRQRSPGTPFLRRARTLRNGSPCKGRFACSSNHSISHLRDTNSTASPRSHPMLSRTSAASIQSGNRARQPRRRPRFARRICRVGHSPKSASRTPPFR